MRGALLLGLVVVLAGCGATRTVRVTDPRAKVRDNVSTPAQVRANFAGRPAQAADLAGGWRCESYGSRQRVLANPAGGPAWVIKVCYRGIPS